MITVYFYLTEIHAAHHQQSVPPLCGLKGGKVQKVGGDMVSEVGWQFLETRFKHKSSHLMQACASFL